MQFSANVITEQCTFPPGTYTVTFEAAVQHNLDANHPKQQGISFTVADVCSPEVLGLFDFVLEDGFADKIIFHDTNSFADPYNENTIARTEPPTDCGNW